MDEEKNKKEKKGDKAVLTESESSLTESESVKPEEEKEILAEAGRLGLGRPFDEFKKEKQTFHRRNLEQAAKKMEMVDQRAREVKSYKDWQVVMALLGEEKDYGYEAEYEDLNNFKSRLAFFSGAKKEEWLNEIERRIALVATLDLEIRETVDFDKRKEKTRRDFSEFESLYAGAVSHIKNYAGFSLAETRKKIAGVNGDSRYPGVMGELGMLMERRTGGKTKKTLLEKIDEDRRIYVDKLLAFNYDEEFFQLNEAMPHLDSARGAGDFKDDLEESVKLAEEILSDPAEARNALNEIQKIIKDVQKITKTELSEMSAEEIDGGRSLIKDGKWRGPFEKWTKEEKDFYEKHRRAAHLLTRTERLRGEREKINKLFAETNREFFRDPKRSAENMAEYTLAWAFDKNLWSEDEAGPVRRLADDYLSLARTGEWSEERKGKARELIREVWPRLNVIICSRQDFDRATGAAVLKGLNLDSRTCLDLFSLAGIERLDLPLVLAEEANKKGMKTGYLRSFPPGAKEKVPGAIMINLGGEEGVFSPVQRQADLLRQKGEAVSAAFYEQIPLGEKTLWCDHHGSMSDVSTSAARFLFDTFEFLGFFEEKDGFFKKKVRPTGITKDLIKETVDYVTMEDNKSNPLWLNQKDGEWENSSPRTVLGITSRLSFRQLLELAKALGGIANFSRILTEEEIKKFDLGEFSKRQKNSVTEAKMAKEQLDKEPFAVFSRHQNNMVFRNFIYRVDSPEFGRIFFTTNGFPGGIDAVRGLFGPDAVYVIYNKEARSMFISTSGRELPDNLLDTGFKLRQKMWIVPGGGDGKDFPSIGEVLTSGLGVTEKDIRGSRFLWDRMKAEETSGSRLSGFAKKFFSDFYSWLIEKAGSEKKVREVLGDRLDALLRGQIETYLRLAKKEKKEERAGDEAVIQNLKRNNLPKLKEKIFDDWKSKNKKLKPEEMEAELKDLLGLAYHDLFEQ